MQQKTDRESPKGGGCVLSRDRAQTPQIIITHCCQQLCRQRRPAGPSWDHIAPENWDQYVCTQEACWQLSIANVCLRTQSHPAFGMRQQLRALLRDSQEHFWCRLWTCDTVEHWSV